MKIQARMSLNLHSSFNTFDIAYNTYEKAAYDQYLAATIVKNCANIEESNKYIDEITGKGSLNEHLKKLVEKARTFNEQTINKILDNSLYPITKIDKTNIYQYYPSFDVSIMKGKTYKGNLRYYNKDEIKRILLLDNDIIKLEVIENGEKSKSDMYDTRLSDNLIEVKLLNEWFELTPDQLDKSYESQLDDITKYKGTINNDAYGEGWYLLTNNVLNNICNSANGFYNRYGNYVQIVKDCLKEFKIIKIYSIYFYKETKFEFNKSNSVLIEQSIDHLFETNTINEIKTKTIINMMQSISDLKSQEVVNYILQRKDSKEIALFGLTLLKKQLEKGWDNESLKIIKKYSDKSDLNCIYKIAPNLEYSKSELLLIDNDLLNENHLKVKNDYLKEINNVKNEINKMIGEITNSGIRERVKSLKTNQNIKQFHKKLNKMIGHAQEDISNFDYDKLMEYYKKVLELYSEYEKINKQLNDNKL